MSAGDFLLFFVLLWYEKKVQKREGEVLGLYLTLYSIGRFIVEFFRGDTIRGQIGILSTSQFIGIFAAAAGLIILIVQRHNGRLVEELLAENIRECEAAENATAVTEASAEDTDAAGETDTAAAAEKTDNNESTDV